MKTDLPALSFMEQFEVIFSINDASALRALPRVPWDTVREWLKRGNDDIRTGTFTPYSQFAKEVNREMERRKARAAKLLSPLPWESVEGGA